MFSGPLSRDDWNTGLRAPGTINIEPRFGILLSCRVLCAPAATFRPRCQVFKQVMAVVETKIANLRDILKAKLKEVNGSFEEQRQIIRQGQTKRRNADVFWFL